MFMVICRVSVSLFFLTLTMRFGKFNQISNAKNSNKVFFQLFGNCILNIFDS